jgi:hypothetical protein
VRAPVIVLLAAAAVLVGCGGDEDDAAGVTRSFLDSVAAGDAPAACGELSESTREKLEKDEMAPCPEALEEVGLSGESAVTDSVVAGTAARVSLAGGEYAFLDRGPGGWTIAAAGCKPAAPGEPYDCELES